MKLSACTVVISLLFLLLPQVQSRPPDCLQQPLSPGDVIVSNDGSFAFGFFCPSNSTPAKLYLGIWYNSIPECTVVWVANRESLISTTGGGISSALTLAVTNTSNLSSVRCQWSHCLGSGQRHHRGDQFDVGVQHS
jgi:hypothetical protein